MPLDNRAYAMVVKPVSGACNLRCGYCYYAGKERLLDVRTPVMSPDVLEAFTRQNLSMHGRDAVVEFAWHGGEPTLAGVGFFREAVRLQEKYGRGRKILNTLQTNGTLLDDEFCAFFREKHFLIGVSVDGPSERHNAYRKTPDGGGSFDAAMRGVELLRKHGVPFNTLTAVHDGNARHPVEVYRFLRELTDYLQFLPVVERLSEPYESEEGGHLAAPPGIHFAGSDNPVAPFSVEPGAYGDFLCAVLDEWSRKDRGKKHVQLIDVALGNLRGVPSSLCVHNPLCGHSGCVEAGGDVYACDRYAFPSYCLGNILETDMGILMERNRRFGMHKIYGLPEECFDCPYLRLCFGGCPKDRFLNGRNYLCEGYKLFFEAVMNLS
ncbi:MAG: anaerobic sulfatase maturase [Synergistaceae bacterium]|nr:anaerobic sulfatase maturase [Synergistaceae bacterium]